MLTNEIEDMACSQYLGAESRLGLGRTTKTEGNSVRLVKDP